MAPQHWLQMIKSAEEVASNEDLMIQIFVCLPVKSLLRFKSVSKPWLHLISSTYFTKTYTLKNPTPSVSALLSYQKIYHDNEPRNFDRLVSYLSLDNSYRPSFRSVPISDLLKISEDAKNIDIVSSCNGLLLLRCSSIIEERIHNNSGNTVYYLVSNPTTKRTSAPLPPPHESKMAERYLEALAFAFDPAEESSLVYRVVCVWSCDFVNFAFKIYSSETGSWRSCPGNFANIPTGICFERGVYWKGNIHYLNGWDGHDSIYLSLQAETLKFLAMPLLQDQGEFEPFHREWCWGLSGGHLWLVENHAHAVIDVYDLKTDYSGWERLYQIRLPEIGSAILEIAPGIITSQANKWLGYALSVVAWDDNKEGVFEIVCMLPGALVAYDPRSRTVKLLSHFNCEGLILFYNVDHWSETLAPVDMGVGTSETS